MALIVERMYDGCALASGFRDMQAFGGSRISGGGWARSLGFMGIPIRFIGIFIA